MAFLQPLFTELLYGCNVKNQIIEYVGRKESASTATGLFKKHVEEQNKILEELFN